MANVQVEPRTGDASYISELLNRYTLEDCNMLGFCCMLCRGSQIHHRLVRWECQLNCKNCVYACCDYVIGAYYLAIICWLFFVISISIWVLVCRGQHTMFESRPCVKESTNMHSVFNIFSCHCTQFRSSYTHLFSVWSGKKWGLCVIVDLILHWYGEYDFRSGHL